MTPEQFIAKWQANTRNERAACQEHFIDLCRLLDEPTPNTDPTGATYAFEKGATKATGDDGWADVWRKERFAWEYKGKRKDLDAAHKQLLLYAGALGNPPLLVVSDISRIVVRTNWTNEVSERHDILLADLADQAKRSVLKSVFSAPERLRPGKTREALTAQAAGEFASLAEKLRHREYEPHTVAHFMIRLAFCLFATDVELLPQDLFARMLEAARKNPDRFEGYARRLFRAMAERGGEVDFTPVQWFNGGLFEDDAALPLEKAEIEALVRAQALDWSEIDPSILGTLFERGLDPSKRSQLGAHYTDRDKIMRIISPVIAEPLAKKWNAVRASIIAILEPARRAAEETVERAGQYAELAEEVKEVRGRVGRLPQPSLFGELQKQRRVRTLDKVRADLRAVSKLLSEAQQEAEDLLRAFLTDLRGFRVLDPACGSGNFLYLALATLKDIEHQTMIEAEALGLHREFPQIGPEAVLGIEVNPYAAELARVSVWIGHIQWARKHGYPAPHNPVLQNLDTIECRDAVVADSGEPANWPEAQAIIGNPPFLGDKSMISTLGESYTARLRTAYEGRVPGQADLVCYWFEKAREAVQSGATSRAGFVATKSISGGASRRVLEQIRAAGTITDAWSNEPWVLDGADVRVSLICFGVDSDGPKLLNGQVVPEIFADLTGSGLDITRARKLRANRGVSFQGPVLVGEFDIDGATARAWLQEPANPNGRSNTEVLRPLINGRDLNSRPRGCWVIDFGSMAASEAAFFAKPFGHVVEKVKPIRKRNRRERRKEYWWQHGETMPGLRRALAQLSRYIVTSQVSKHRVFSWAHPRVQPHQTVIAIVREDDTTLGILQSRFHEAWALRLGTRIGVGNDPRYTPSTTFETFPLPDGLTPDIPAATYVTDPRAERIAMATRALMNTRDRWLNPPELVNKTTEVVPGLPDRLIPRDAAAATLLKKRTLTALYNTRGTPAGVWLDNLHRDLDAAVAAAYGWPADISNDDALARLLALNLERANAD